MPGAGGLDRSPKQNWVDKAGGLPSYIERIARHLHAQGMSISAAIASSVNTVKRWAAGGTVRANGGQRVTAKTQAQAAAALADWERKKASARSEALAEMEAWEAMTVEDVDLSALVTESVELTEATGFGEAIKGPAGKRMRIRAISPGWGSSGYYSKEMLKETADKGAFSVGTHMYMDHPTADQNEARPERSVRDLAAVITSPGVYESDGVYADIDVFPPFREALAAMKDHIGVSIRALGMAEQGEAEGREGTIISELSEIKSVDFVTRAGRGGQITALLESARQVSEGTTTTGGPVSGTETQGTPATGTPIVDAPQLTIPGTVSEAEKQVTDLRAKLAEATATLEVRNDAVHQAAEAKRLLAEATVRIARLSATETARSKTQAAFAESKLPDVCAGPVIARVLGHEGGSLPLTEANVLDDVKLAEAIKASVKAEETYVAQIAEALGVGAPKGLGDTTARRSDADEYKQLTENFKELGLSDELAALATKGRS